LQAVRNFQQSVVEDSHLSRSRANACSVPTPRVAVTQRQPRRVIHHSDRGSQYTSYAFGKRCQEAGIMPSTGSVGDAYNAMAESFFASLEREVLNRRRFKSQAEARMAIFEWIEGWYNPHRRHSGLGYRSPVSYERTHHQARAGTAELLPPAAADSLSGKISKAA
jgi:putative transposase